MACDHRKSVSCHFEIVETASYMEQPTQYSCFYRLALPRGSNGISKAIKPVPMNIAPDTKIGTEVVRSAYSAMIGALSKVYAK